MDTRSEPVIGKRVFDDGSSESVSSTTFAPDGTVAESLTSSMAGEGKARSSRSVTTGCRSRVTVVCGECKRLKLKCDRRAPCGSCLKRDTVPRCIYSPAAVEKVDIQSVNNRVLALEELLRNHNIPINTASTVPARPRVKASTSAIDAPSTSRARAYLAVTPNGASVAVNLEGSAGIWLSHLGLGPPSSGAAAAGNAGGLSNFDILPASGVREEGVIDFLNEYTKWFRVPVKPAEDSADDDDVLGYVGVTPDLVFAAIPAPDVRNQIYPYFEAAHVMAPCVNIFVFKQRIEDMYQWAQSKDVDSDEPDPMRPTVNFFAAAALAMAVGMECMFLERESKPVPATSLGSSPAEGPVSGSTSASTDRSMGPPPVPESPYPSDYFPHIDHLEPGKLFRLSKLALALSMERIGYDALDLDYLHAKTLQVRYLLLSQHGLENGSNLRLGMSVRERKISSKRGKGRARTDKSARHTDAIMTDATSSQKTSGNRSPHMALAPEIVGIVGEMTSSARFMGLNHDPDAPGGEKFSLYDKEMRRRLWWEIAGLDAFLADCIGEDPLLSNSASTNLPIDVDEEAFLRDVTEYPPPNIESKHGNIDYFVQRSKLVSLSKRWKRKWGIFREENGIVDSPEARDLIEIMSNEFAQWSRELPDYLRLKEIPSLGSAPYHLDMKGMSPPKRTSVPPGDRGTPAQYEPPFILSMRCELAISSRYAFIMFCLPFAQEMRDEDVDGFDFGGSSRNMNAHYLMPPAMFIVRAWQYIHSIFKYIRPSLLCCYSFTKELFDAAVVLANIVIQHPLYYSSALASVRVAADILRDPAVLASLPASGDYGSRPNEAVKIIEELILKAESVSVGTPGSSKRKHEEVDGGFTDFMYHFRFPFVGPDVVSGGPPNAPITPSSADASTLVDASSTTAAPPSRIHEAPSKSHSKQSPVDRGAKTGDPRPAQVKAKASHISVRSRVGQKGKEASRARANSTASVRSEGYVMAPPPAPLHLPPPSAPVAHQQHSPTELSAGISNQHAPFSAPLSPTKSSGLHPPLGFMGPPPEGSLDDFPSGSGSGTPFHGDGGGFPRPTSSTSFPNSSPFTHTPLQMQNRGGFDAFGSQGSSSVPTPTHEAMQFGPGGVEFPMNMQPHNDFDMMSHHPPSSNPEPHRFGRDPSEQHHDAGRGVLEGPSPFHHGHGHDQSQAPHGEHMSSLDSSVPQSWGGQPPVYPSGGWPQGPFYHQ